MQIGLWGLFGAAASTFRAGSRLEHPVVDLLTDRMWDRRRARLPPDRHVRVLAVLVGAEFLVVIVLGAVIATEGGDFGTSSLNLQPFAPDALFAGSLPIALLFCFASFVGFEATVV